jgi:hypothetical protein
MAEGMAQSVAVCRPHATMAKALDTVPHALHLAREGAALGGLTCCPESSMSVGWGRSSP